ncbi:response regulator transcription factor, partial [Prevotella sp.]
AANILLAPISTPEKESVKLTKTEIEVLKDIALGMTTREIAEKRISSFHTINTHRKNIFRKIGVNNVHEATRYAMRTGLVDAAEYYI